MYRLMLIIFLSWISLSWAANHYVDKNATSGANNGTSWINAWQSFAAINWSSVEPGDIIYISGGTDSTVYYEQLYIGNVQGTAADPITIKNSYDAGHNGKVIIDGGDGARNCILIGNSDGYSTDYFTFSGLELTGGDKCIWIHNRARSLIFDSLTVTDWTINGLLTQGTTGVPEAIDGVTIQNSSWIGVPLGEGEDCLQFNSSSNHIIRNNFIHQRNSKRENNHVDGILGMWSEGYRVYNNVIIVDSNAQGQAIIIRAWADAANEDSVIIYNNFMYQGGIWDSNEFPWTSVLNLRWQDHPPNVKPPTFVAHNTIVSYGRYVQGVVHEVPSTFVNNIVAQFGNGVTPSSTYWLASMRGTDGTIDADSIRNNIIWREYEPGSSPMFTGTWYGNGTSASNFGWSTWTGTLGGAGVNANPLFVDQIGYIGDQSTLDGELQSGSPAINQGEDLQAIIEQLGLPWTDINGNARDNTPDIGAYQYVPRGPDITPPEVTGATLLDSVTLKIMFSELIDETTAEDENNYSISNNIDIFNASLSGSEITLQTSTHSPSSYIVTVVNVEDLAGNPIAQSNTAEYSLIPPDSLIFLPIEDVQGVIQEPGHTPLKTIDGLGALSGDPDSRWAAEPMPEELIFDLGTNRTVCKTKLSFYNWNYGRVYTYSVLISSDNNNWVTIVSQATSASNEEWTIDEFPAIDARYVKVDFITNNQSAWAGLWEGEIWGIVSTVADPVNNGLPNEFSLHQNYPNPFNPSTTISYSIPISSFVTLKVYDVLGNEVATLVNAKKPVGSYEVKFDAVSLPSGIYFYRLQANEFAQVKKMILLK